MSDFGESYNRTPRLWRTSFWGDIKELDWPSCTEEDKPFFQMLLITKGLDWYLKFNAILRPLMFDLVYKISIYIKRSTYPDIEQDKIESLIYNTIFKGEVFYQKAYGNPRYLLILRNDCVDFAGTLPKIITTSTGKTVRLQYKGKG